MAWPNPEAVVIADPVDGGVVLPELGTEVRPATLADFDPRLLTPFPQSRPPGNPELVLNPDLAAPGDRLDIAVRNETSRKVSSGLAVRVERRRGPRWVDADKSIFGTAEPGFRLIRLFALPGGRMVPPAYDDSLRLPRRLAPGRYRVLRRVNVGRRETTLRAEFHVR